MVSVNNSLSSSVSITLEINPISLALCAFTSFPVMIISIALDIPISFGNRTVPPSISGTPNLRQNTPNFAVLSAIRISHHSANSNPPATAYPEIQAIVGLVSNNLEIPINPMLSKYGVIVSDSFECCGCSILIIGVAFGIKLSFVFPSATAVKSAPAQKLPPSPRKIATFDLLSFSKDINVSYNAFWTRESQQFRLDGRLMDTIHMVPSSIFCSFTTGDVVMFIDVQVKCTKFFSTKLSLLTFHSIVWARACVAYF